MAVHWHDSFGRYLVVNGGLVFLKVSADEDGTAFGLNLEWRAARALSAGLTAACDELEATLPNRCACGAPIEEDESDCVACELVSRAEHRRTFRNRNGVE